VAVAILAVGLIAASSFIFLQERRILRMVAQLPPDTQEILLMGMDVGADDLARIKTTIGRLEDADRAASQKPAKVLSALNLRPGERVADIGAGSGYFTVPIAQIVESSGQVWAVDVDAGLVDFLGKRLKLKGIQNVRLSLVPPDDPQLPARSIDTILLVNTYRYLENRQAYASKLRDALAPGGRVVIIDEPPDPSGQDTSRIDRTAVDSEMATVGFEPISSHDVLPTQYFVEYAVR
jgi:protein-L-isoaspartate O-methyltransferase